MTICIAASRSLAFLLVALLVLSGGCNSTGGTLDKGSGGKVAPTGGAGQGGANGGGTAGAGNGGTAGDSSPRGTGGAGQGGAAGGRGGAAGTNSASGGSGGKGGSGTSAGGSAGTVGKGGSSTSDTGKKDASPDVGPVACDDITSTGRLAVYYYDDSAVSGSSIQMHFDVVNYTAYSSRLPQVTIRYWFTDEAASSANIVEQYYVPIPTTMKFTTLNPPRAGADTVLELSFRDMPDSGVSWVETRGFNFAFHKTSYAGTYDQSNDYSYDSKLTKALGPNPKITAYVNGVLAWGCEPPLQPVVIDGGAVADANPAAADAGSGG